ncbi:hypothetical protein RCL1_000558 [Eukaryota sp. TZLM3-RCL]
MSNTEIQLLLKEAASFMDPYDDDDVPPLLYEGTESTVIRNYLQPDTFSYSPSPEPFEEEFRPSDAELPHVAPPSKSRKRRTTSPAPPSKRRPNPWSPREDSLLTQAVSTLNTPNWKGWQNVAKAVGSGRTADMCSQRWYRCLSPSIKKGKWSSDEDTVLKRLVEMHGEKNWKEVSKGLPGRSDIQCRYRWVRMVKNNNS